MMESYAELLIALGNVDLPMPSAPEHEIEKQAATFENLWEAVVKRCTIVIRDAGPIISLWMADQLPLLLALDMRIVVIDAIYDELTSYSSHLQDSALKAFIGGNQPPFVIEGTEIGQRERDARLSRGKLRKNAVEVAIAEFMSSEDGLRKYLGSGDPVVILFEDTPVQVFNKPPHLHLISTVGMLRGLERVGVISSAKAIIHEMTHPSKPDRVRPH